LDRKGNWLAWAWGRCMKETEAWSEHSISRERRAVKEEIPVAGESRRSDVAESNGRKEFQSMEGSGQQIT